MLSNTLGVRIEKKDKEILEYVCKARGEDLSSFIRRAIRKELATLSYYPEDVKKALGVTIDNGG
jgi:hypothetical protein